MNDSYRIFVVCWSWFTLFAPSGWFVEKKEETWYKTEMRKKVQCLALSKLLFWLNLQHVSTRCMLSRHEFYRTIKNLSQIILKKFDLKMFLSFLMIPDTIVWIEMLMTNLEILLSCKIFEREGASFSYNLLCKLSGPKVILIISRVYNNEKKFLTWVANFSWTALANFVTFDADINFHSSSQKFHWQNIKKS